MAVVFHPSMIVPRLTAPLSPWNWVSITFLPSVGMETAWITMLAYPFQHVQLNGPSVAMMVHVRRHPKNVQQSRQLVCAMTAFHCSLSFRYNSLLLRNLWDWLLWSGWLWSEWSSVSRGSLHIHSPIRYWRNYQLSWSLWYWLCRWR